RERRAPRARGADGRDLRPGGARADRRDGARGRRHLRPAARADHRPALAGGVGGQVRARPPLLHASALRVAPAPVPVRWATRPRFRAGGGADDSDGRLPGVRPLMSPPPPFSWTSGEIHADVVLLVGAAALGYAVAWAGGPRAGIARPARFAAALIVLL